MSESFFRFVLKHKILVILLTVAVSLMMGSGVQHLRFNNDYRMFFSEENPQLKAFEMLQNTYTKNDNVLFVIEPQDGKVFTRETLTAVTELTKEAWQIPYSIRVDSITNFQHTYAEGDDLIVEDLVLDPASLNDEELATKQQIATNDPLLRNRLISPTAHTTGVNVTVQLPGKKLTEVPEVAAKVKQMAKNLEASYPDIKVHLTGMVIMNNAFPTASQDDMKSLYPIMFGAVILVLVLMLRSIPGTISTLIIILLMIIATMGLTGWLGIKMSPPTTTVPIVIMTLAIADCVHILVNFLHFMREGEAKYQAMMESLRINLQPIFLTTLTTAIGFLSLNFSDAPPFRDLGNMAAMGVVLAFLLSITFLPAMMMLLPVKALSGDTMGSLAMVRFAEFVIRNKKQLLWGMGILILFLIVQIPSNRLDDRFVEYFDETIDFRQDTDFATDNLTGIYLIEYSLESGETGGISDPDFLRKVDGFAQWYRQQPHVLHVNTITDIMKRLNRNMHADDDSWYRLPEQRDLSAQYLLLYEFSLPFGLDLNNQINVKKSATRFTVTLESISTQQLLQIEEDAQQWLLENAPEMRSDGASPSVMFAHIGSRNIIAMLKGTTTALIIISLILVVALRSLRIGGISLIPNLVPMGMAFGLWGLTVGEVGLALSVVSGMTLGIVVDDTVHFLSKYLRARREKNMSGEDAVRYAFSTVGTALWVTSLVLMVGFGILAFSHFQLNAGMGLLTAITLGLALVADFLFLPPLLIYFGGKKP
ncbi:MAG: MMPL family transporter [Candidatus Thiodiazotropha lotti]|uniref:RND transporter n=1 Tax=Candidatus Thiodiazotropha endoloripes TaxID=1818881 RepID=A0A1E2URV7_9GAMM|nr:MMPL family transporter [Candidatus Thiodiazotropha endoloripes]MCG7897917.1 MMPL family transporter [Candidatus Thiodiazotropha weberae]MCG7990325.1 MMPL family transporter [Candidatus Thiodiazotropha lotti]MCG7902667.1 MMPL family transporter [Candidatus Thiodiazotropha weberae]MCG7913422.1 MMPL family transporter [Candidatus Thiodiazotropha weberae]MCG7999038.1 MMPL family transporter [Candidatus Thiodiazotropha lotti]